MTYQRRESQIRELQWPGSTPYPIKLRPRVRLEYGTVAGSLVAEDEAAEDDGPELIRVPQLSHGSAAHSRNGSCRNPRLAAVLYGW